MPVTVADVVGEQHLAVDLADQAAARVVRARDRVGVEPEAAAGGPLDSPGRGAQRGHQQGVPAGVRRLDVQAQLQRVQAAVLVGHQVCLRGLLGSALRRLGALLGRGRLLRRGGLLRGGRLLRGRRVAAELQLLVDLGDAIGHAAPQVALALAQQGGDHRVGALRFLSHDFLLGRWEPRPARLAGRGR
jgi:hypothetical protein